LPDTATTSPLAVAYEPRWPLWSDGLTKARWIVLPTGATVDDSDRGRWQFPLGTLFFKTFSTEERPIETRVLRLRADGWEYAAYIWNVDASDASLADIDAGAIGVNVSIGGEQFEHEVPPRLDCKKCHESNTTTIIGFDELRLNSPSNEDPSQLEAFHRT